MVEILVVVFGIGVLVLAYIAVSARADAVQSRNAARSHAADAVVQKARATKYKQVLEKWGENVEDLERKVEAAHEGKVGPAIASFSERVRAIRVLGRKKSGPGGAGGGGEGGGLPGS